jgi:tRNA A-37 threonylcarbamoyl transferase component Bud32
MEIVRWIGKIGEGAFSTVWEAEDHLGRKVAVKLLDPSAEEPSCALDHARALVRARHPNVVDVYDVVALVHPTTNEQVSAVVMEFLTGRSLEREIQANRRFDVGEVEAIGRQILAGVEHIHSQGLTHGDLHGGNVVVDGSSVKLIDILYRDTLQLMSTISRNAMIRRDCLQLRMLLADLMEHSDLDFGVVRAFNASVTEATSVAEIRDAFLASCDPTNSTLLERRIQFALDRFLDPQFVDSAAYAAALDAETDDDVVCPLLEKIVESNRTREAHGKYIVGLWNRISEGQQDLVLRRAATRLNEELPGKGWYPHIAFLDCLGKNAWLRLPRVQRLRIEGIMVKDILEGRFDIFAAINRGGELSTWALGRGELFEDRDGLIESLCTMLHRDWYTQNFVGKYLMPVIPLLGDTAMRKRRLISALRAAVRNDAKIVKANLHVLPDEWRREVTANGG